MRGRGFLNQVGWLFGTVRYVLAGAKSIAWREPYNVIADNIIISIVINN